MKRVCSALLCVVLLLGVIAVAPVTAATLWHGDVNEDGNVNNRDLAMLQQHLNGWDVTIHTVAADVNEDGNVNNRDLAMLQQYLNGWDVELGPVIETPAVELPAVGYDLDGRGRILVDTISLDGNVVNLTLTNISSKWMTEETSCVAYTCTDADGNVLTTEDKYFGVLYLGMLEALDTDSYTITLPEGTVKLEFGECRINYWSQWA